MATDVGGLLADVGFNIAGLRADVGKANQLLSSGTAQMNRHLGSLQKQVNSAVGSFKTLVGIVGLGVLANKVRNVVTEVDGLAKAAQTAGLRAESIQELRFAFAQLADVTDQQVDMSMQRFNRRLGLAVEGSGAAGKTFGKLGISLVDASGKIRATDDVLNDTLEALGRITNDAERAARASEVFGDETGPKLAVALSRGVREMEELRRQAHELGLVLSDEMVKGAEDAADKIDVLGRVLGVGFQQMILANVDHINTFADAFLKVADFAFSAAGKVADFARVMGEMAAGGIGFGPEADFFERQIRGLEKQREVLQNVLEQQKGLHVSVTGNPVLGGPVRERFGSTRINVSQALDMLSEIEAEIERLKQSQSEAFAPPSSETHNAGREAGRSFAEGVAEGVSATTGGKSLAEWGFTARRMTVLTGPEIVFEPLVDEAEQAAERIEGKFDDLGQSMGRSMQDSLADAFLGIETNFGDMLKRMVAQAAASGLLNAIGAAIPGGSVVGKIAGFLGFGGARAEGGPVSPGKAFLVGERGPEMFVPGAAGRIVPNGGGAQVTQNITLHFDVGLESVDQRIAQAAPMVAAAAQAGIARAFGRPSMA